jgi:hypothetical protein
MAEPWVGRCGAASLLSALLILRRYRSGEGLAAVGDGNAGLELVDGKVRSRAGTLLKSKERVLPKAAGMFGSCCGCWDVLG